MMRVWSGRTELAQHAAAVRAGVLVIWCVVLLRTPYPDYALLPADMFVGFGVGRVVLSQEWLKGVLLSAPVLETLRWTGICLCVSSIVWRQRSLWLVTFCVVFLLDLVTKSIEAYPNHAQFGPLAVLFAMSVFAATEARCDGTHDRNASAEDELALWCASVLLILPYTYIGVGRVVEGGAELFTGDALLRYVAYTSRLYSAYDFGVPMAWLDNSWFNGSLKVGFALTTICEVLSPGVFVSSRCRVAWLLAVTTFHVGTLLVMNILFWENVILLWLVLGWGRDGRRVAIVRSARWTGGCGRLNARASGER